jgi:hypothetical protein
MTLRLLSLLAIAMLASSALRAAENDKEVEARKVALELAGAFSNDGFKIRDGHWAGTIEAGKPTVVAVNLYAGNQYWFSVGAEDKATKVAVHVHDENGKPQAVEDYQGEATAAAGFAPNVSGQYFVSIAGDAAENNGTYCLVYSYK